MKKLLVAGMAALSMVSAGAETITYDDLERSGTSLQEVDMFNEDYFFTEGRLLSAEHEHELYAGSASIFAIQGDAVFFYKQDLSAFTINSIDLAPLFRTQASKGQLTFYGMFQDGGTIEQTFDLNNTYTFTTYHFRGFSNLLQVYWIQDYDYVHQFDNIVVDEAAQIPEPGSLALLGLGILGLAAARRKSNPARH